MSKKIKPCNIVSIYGNCLSEIIFLGFDAVNCASALIFPFDMIQTTEQLIDQRFVVVLCAVCTQLLNMDSRSNLLSVFR